MKNIFRLASIQKIPGKIIFQQNFSPTNVNRSTAEQVDSIADIIENEVKAPTNEAFAEVIMDIYCDRELTVNLANKSSRLLVRDNNGKKIKDKSGRNKGLKYGTKLTVKECKYEKSSDKSGGEERLHYWLRVEDVDGADIGWVSAEYLKLKNENTEQVAKESSQKLEKQKAEELALKEKTEAEKVKKAEELALKEKTEAEKMKKAEESEKIFDNIENIDEEIGVKTEELQTAAANFAETKILQFSLKKELKEEIKTLGEKIAELKEERAKLVRENEILLALKNEPGAGITKESQEKIDENNEAIKKKDEEIQAKQYQMDNLNGEVKNIDASLETEERLLKNKKMALEKFKKAIKENAANLGDPLRKAKLMITYKNLVATENAYDQFCAVPDEGEIPGKKEEPVKTESEDKNEQEESFKEDVYTELNEERNPSEAIMGNTIIESTPDGELPKQKTDAQIEAELITADIDLARNTEQYKAADKKVKGLQAEKRNATSEGVKEKIKNKIDKAIARRDLLEPVDSLADKEKLEEKNPGIFNSVSSQEEEQKVVQLKDVDFAPINESGPLNKIAKESYNKDVFDHMNLSLRLKSLEEKATDLGHYPGDPLVTVQYDKDSEKFYMAVDGKIVKDDIASVGNSDESLEEIKAKFVKTSPMTISAIKLKVQE